MTRGAGGGRPAKPADQRRNRVPSKRTSTALPPRPPRRKVPPPIVELTDDGKKLWAALWAMPEASQWREVDVPALSRLVWLQQNPEHWGDNKMLAEMRQLEDRFGMSAHSRKLLGWEYPNEPEKPAQPAKPEPKADRKETAMKLLRGGQAS